MRNRLSFFSLTNKLSILFTTAILFTVIILGVYFDGFLSKQYNNQTQKQVAHSFHRLAYNLQKIKDNLRQELQFIENDEPILASINLVNNYQDKNNYQAELLDEEKQFLASELLERVKHSMNDQLAVYDRNNELIAYIYRNNNEYILNYFSYMKGEKQLYIRNENDKQFRLQYDLQHKSIPFNHVAYYKNDILWKSAPITIQNIDDSIIITSHFSLYEQDTNQAITHFELSRVLDRKYFSELSRDFDVDLFYTANAPDDFKNVRPLLQSGKVIKFDVKEHNDKYYSVTSINTEGNVPLYFYVQLDKKTFNKFLSENRQKFLLLILIITAVILFTMRIFLHLNLARPLSMLMKQIDMIEEGNYNLSDQVHTGDELESVSINIHELAHAVRDRELSLQSSRENLEYLSNHDALTGLPNRRFFSQRLEHSLEITRRHSIQLAVLFLDLDHFKNINDTLGHDIGDMLLKQVADRLLEKTRATDTLVRIGGDEFILLIEHFDTANEIEVVVQKILDVFKEPFICNSRTIYIATSIGIAVYPRDGADAVTLVKHADLAMYKAKEDGRNNHRYFSSTLSLQLQERTKLVNAIKYAIQYEQEFVLHYQPKVSLSTDRTISLEALIRWNSSEYGMVMPNDFIPVAEETGLIIPLGNWLLLKACQDFISLRAQGYELEHIAINISNLQLNNECFIATLQKVLDATGIEASCIELEITESFIASHTDSAMQTLQAIRNMGVKLAIDDFGTGYSSMNYLQQLPITRLKIDKTFVKGLPYHEGNSAIARAMIGLARTFGLDVTIEGIETREQERFFIDEQCDEGQGYYYSKPVAIEDLAAVYHQLRQEKPRLPKIRAG